MAVRIQKDPKAPPHIEWIDLYGNGMMYECAILKKDPRGNVTYFETNKLDNIDKKRLHRIVTSRNARSFPLWELMSQITLPNGMNSLEYFHQLAKTISPEGVIMSPRSGVLGTGVRDTMIQNERKDRDNAIASAAREAASAAAVAAAAAFAGGSGLEPPRGRGRPRKHPREDGNTSVDYNDTGDNDTDSE
jgi:hypothetical protein